MPDQRSTKPTEKETTLPEDSTSEADQATRARIEDAEATAKWNEEDRANPGREN